MALHQAERPWDFLVVGVTCPEVKGGAKNHFAKAFKNAAEPLRSGYRPSSGFDGNAVEVDRDDVR